MNSPKSLDLGEREGRGSRGAMARDLNLMPAQEGRGSPQWGVWMAQDTGGGVAQPGTASGWGSQAGWGGAGRSLQAGGLAVSPGDFRQVGAPQSPLGPPPTLFS